MQVGLNPLTVTPTGGKAAAVTFTDFIACAAIEHVLDTVLLPKSVSLAFPLQYPPASSPYIMPQARLVIVDCDAVLSTLAPSLFAVTPACRLIHQ